MEKNKFLKLIFCPMILALLLGLKTETQNNQNIFIDGFGVVSLDYTTINILTKDKLPFSSLPPSIIYPIKYFRYLGNKNLEQELDQCSLNIPNLKKSFNASASSSVDFNTYWKKEDPYCWKTAENISPKMYFDFRGEETKAYYLESVQVEVVDFLAPKNSGGYQINEMKKDICLKMKKGTQVLQMSDPKLMFKGRGRVEYTFWSEHYTSISPGNFPKKATYLLGIKFTFSDDLRNTFNVPDQGFYYFIVQI